MIAFWLFDWPVNVPDLPDDLARDWFGLGTWALIVAGFVVALTILYKIKNQVVNGHTTPLRTDIDGIQTAVLGLVGEMRAERDERRTDVKELHSDVQELHVKLDELRKVLPDA